MPFVGQSNSAKSGVYLIRNLVNGKVYVGSAVKSLKERCYEHKRMLRKGVHRNIFLQRAWRKYGEPTFEFSVIVMCWPEYCLVYEQKFMDLYQSANQKFGYNISPTAGNSRGVKMSEESRKKMSLAGKGRRKTKEHAQKIGDSRRGKMWTEEMKQRMSQKKMGTKMSVEACKKMSIAHKGHKMSPEAIAKTAAWHRGKKRSQQAVANMQKAQLARFEKARQQKLLATGSETGLRRVTNLFPELQPD